LLKEARDRDLLRQGKLLIGHTLVVSRQASESSKVKGHRGQERIKHSHEQIITEREASPTLPEGRDGKWKRKGQYSWKVDGYAEVKSNRLAGKA